MAIPSKPDSGILVPAVRALLAQAVYSNIVATYFSESERDGWEKVFADEGVVPDTISRFIADIESKAGKSVTELVRETVRTVEDDAAECVVGSIADAALPSVRQPI